MPRHVSAGARIQPDQRWPRTIFAYVLLQQAERGPRSGYGPDARRGMPDSPKPADTLAGLIPEGNL